MANCRQSVGKAPNDGITRSSVTCLDQSTFILQGDESRKSTGRLQRFWHHLPPESPSNTLPVAIMATSDHQRGLTEVRLGKPDRLAQEVSYGT